MGWSLVTKVAFGRLSDPAGRNVSEAWAGLESDNADAYPPATRGKIILLVLAFAEFPHSQGHNRRSGTIPYLVRSTSVSRPPGARPTRLLSANTGLMRCSKRITTTCFAAVHGARRHQRTGLDCIFAATCHHESKK